MSKKGQVSSVKVESIKATFSVWIRLIPYLKPYFFHCVLLMTLIIIQNAGALSSPYFLKLIIDNGLMAQDYPYLIQSLVILLMIVVVRLVAGYFADFFYTWISNKVTVRLMVQIFGHIIYLPISYFKENPTGSIVYTINNELNIIRRAFTGTVVSLINNVVTLFILVTIMSSLSLNLFLIITFLYPAIVIIMKHFSPKVKAIVRETREKESGLLAFLTERILNVKFIKLFNSFSGELENLTHRISGLVDASLRATIVHSISKNASNFILALIPLIVLLYGGKQVIEETITIGALIAFLQYTNKLNAPIVGLVNIYAEMVRTSVSIERLFGLIDEPSENNAEDGIEIEEPIQQICFENISLSIKEKKIITDCSFVLQMGKCFAIVGPSGGGKTSLINLLTKLYHPTSGQIRVNTTDLADINFGHWMGKVAVCSQDYFIINGTVRENILYPSLKVNSAQLTEVAEVMGLSELLDQEVGEQGGTLSGGQKHRIAIARGILSDPEVLILDETTSEIDSEHEHRVFEYLKGRINTVIVISHRFISLSYVDEILYVKDGNILTSGSLDDLTQNSLDFQKLFKLG